MELFTRIRIRPELKITLSLLFIFFFTEGKAQENFANGKIVYSIKVIDKDLLTPQAIEVLERGKLIYYFKKQFFRSEMRLGNTVYITIRDSKDQTGLSLIKGGEGNNYLVRMSASDLQKEALKFKGMSLKGGGEEEVISGYTTVRLIAHLASGEEADIYFSPELKPTYASYNPRFKDVKGIPLKFQANIGRKNAKIEMTAIEVTPGFLPSSLFQAPTTGFRELTYEEIEELRNN